MPTSSSDCSGSRLTWLRRLTLTSLPRGLEPTFRPRPRSRRSPGETAGPHPFDDPDGALMAWSDTEYRLFQAFERALVAERLNEGFSGASAVEDFLSFSLSVQNRRKSRSGHAFEHHLAAA